MTVEAGAMHAPTRLSHWLDRFHSWRRSATWLLAVDCLAVMIAASLPWSTSARTSLLVVLWVIVVAPTIDWETFVRDLAHPACALPVLLLALAALGTLWADGAWAVRLHGIKPVAKPPPIPFLLYHFQRTQRGAWVLIAFLASCTLLMILSWVVLFVPGLKPAHTLSAGVPVKNYIDQNQEFALCAFALALPDLIAWRWGKWKLAAGCLALALAFVANMLFVALARTALIYMAVLLVLFAWRHLGRRSMFALLAGAIVAASLIWTNSPYLRQRVADIGVEYQAQDIKRDRVDGAATDLLAQGDQVPCRGPAARPRHRLDQGAIRARCGKPNRTGGRDRRQPAQPDACRRNTVGAARRPASLRNVAEPSPAVHRTQRSRRGSGSSSSFKTSSAHC